MRNIPKQQFSHVQLQMPSPKGSLRLGNRLQPQNLSCYGDFKSFDLTSAPKAREKISLGGDHRGQNIKKRNFHHTWTQSSGGTLNHGNNRPRHVGNGSRSYMRSWDPPALKFAILTHDADLGWGLGSPESTVSRRCSESCRSAGPSRKSPDSGFSAQGLQRGLSSPALERDRETPTPPGAGERQDEDDTPEDQNRTHQIEKLS